MTFHKYKITNLQKYGDTSILITYLVNSTLLIKNYDKKLTDVLFQISASPLSYGFYPSYPPFDHYDKRSREGHLPMPASQETLFLKKSLERTDNFKTEENVAEPVNRKAVERLYKIGANVNKLDKEDIRQYTVYNGYTSEDNIGPSSNSQFTLVDLTTNPGEVQADYSLDLPFNGFHFQSSTPIIST